MDHYEADIWEHINRIEEYPEVPMNRDRESPSVKEFHLIYDSLANPAAPQTGSPLRFDKLYGECDRCFGSN